MRITSAENGKDFIGTPLSAPAASADAKFTVQLVDERHRPEIPA
jgi:hypothetical protein